ncbi:MAG: 4Fe-4S dicluster domain-containing protein [Methanoregula sp.]|nr:4Fe-4S dicluster domain-containing protein [Methanoregula sp.]
MKRKIIQIDEKRCTGCGQCIPDCPEGALQLIEGKARLVSDLSCDGLGACIGTCPEGAIHSVEREAEAYNERVVMENIARQGPAVIRAHLEHLTSHRQQEYYHQALEYLDEHNLPVPPHSKPKAPSGEPSCPGHGHVGSCPGSAARSIARGPFRSVAPAPSRKSELRQWPIQLALLNPDAAYFEDADLLISADCAPFAYADLHKDLLRDRIVIIFCPKLDLDIEGYITKLAEIFSKHAIKSVTVLRMEVPCCGGVRYVLDQALGRSGKTISVTEKTVTIQGEIV